MANSVSRTIQKNHKVESSLIDYVYSQINIAILASFFCAATLFVGVYDATKSNHELYIWSTIFLIINLARLIQSQHYKRKKHSHIDMKFWRNLYVFGCFLGGACWGLVAIILLPQAGYVQQALMVLMLAGVSAGSVPLSAAIPRAGIAFLVMSILPFIIAIIWLKNSTYYLFDMVLTLYLAYTIILTFKTYHMIKNTIILKYKNDFLLASLEISNKKLESAATHDPLTNIANRRLFITNIEHAIERVKKNNSMFALFYIDLDNFKFSNDTYGHDAGDFILKNVIYKLSVFFRKDDVISRLGGDELAILVEGINNKDEIEGVANKICQLIAIPMQMDGVNLFVTASIGISLYPGDGENWEELVTNADKSMYHVKKQGGNGFYLK